MSMVSDFHSHILPGIDDGSRSLKESIALLRLEAEQGVKLVAATPHFYAQRDTLEHFLQRRSAAAGQLRAAMAQYDDLPEVILGAEVYYFRGISHSEAVRKLALEGTNYVLIEMPMGPWRESMYRELVQISENLGLIPIIAHVDRYLGPFAARRIPKRLAELPVLVQANAEFFLQSATAAKAMHMLRQGQIHLLGSDCHNLTDRTPNLHLAVNRIQRRMGSESLEWIREHERLVLSSTGKGRYL